MLVDFEGGLHPTRSVKDLAMRQKKLGVVLRVRVKEKRPHIMGT